MKERLADSGVVARQLLKDGAIWVDDRRLAADKLVVRVKRGTIIRVGNRRFVQIVDAPQEVSP